MKRNAKGGGSIRQRDDGTWEARCTINGKRRSFYGQKQSEVVKAMRAALASADSGLFIEPSKITVDDWMSIWLNEYVKPSVKPLTYSTYKGRIASHIIPALGKVKLSSLDPTQVQKFYNDMLREKNLSPKTIKDVHGILHKALEQAVKVRYILFNPADACTVPRLVKKEILPLTETDVEAFLSAIEGHPFQPLFTVTLFTGMREGEVCGLPWDAVDFRNGTVTIKQQLCKQKEKGGTHYIDTPKHDKTRVLTVPDFVLDILKDIKTKQLQDHLELGTAFNNEYNLVFTYKDGRFIPPNTMRRHFKKIVESIGRPEARFHDLRHTYAVNALQEGDDYKTLQENLGHATAAFTLNVYGHVSDRMKRESANRMQRYFNRVKA